MSSLDKKLIYDKMKSLYSFMEYFSPKQEELFIEGMFSRQFTPGSVLMEDGFSCNNIFFILDGSIRISRISEEGREVVLYRIHRGDFCLMTAYSIMTDTDFPAIAQVEEQTEVIALPAKVFKQILQENPQLQSFIFASSLNRLKDVIGVLENITFTGIKQRLAKFLIMLANERSSDKLKITHEQIALEIGSSREVISRTLKNLEEEGAVQLSRGRIQILSLESLKKIILL
ncbi:Crp/Fnr family transcriptional regulator [Dethiobacter alkaliphilus]|uniref:Transcriptional regulator, Crp/Fnr family n=1 Tax=Dethiobacter alkaliphilus AHT 1 TaxID=555088 RepID=C0GCF9_DETAL|nr:Crp/Fnr family transcriptional regulator [Dethiobacter alkaliphilus]EEG78894.1 transcriptional regulator, Crp/Fnr family [Dethiobacter alkaliphilus AHT 1]